MLPFSHNSPTRTVTENSFFLQSQQEICLGCSCCRSSRLQYFRVLNKTGYCILWMHKKKPSGFFTSFFFSCLFVGFLFNHTFNVFIVYQHLYPSMYRISNRIPGHSLNGLFVYSTNLMSFSCPFEDLQLAFLGS